MLLASNIVETIHQNMKKIFTIFTLAASVTCTTAQIMTMDECMAYAIENSISVGKQKNSLDNSEMNYRESVAMLFPSLSAGTSGSVNFGRSIDPETNNYTTKSTFSNSYSLSSSMPVFAGLRYVNNVRAAKVARERGVQELQIAKDRVALDVMKAYINVIYYKGAVNIAKEHLEASRNLLQKTQKLYELGRKSAAEVADVASQEANYDYLLAEQENHLAMAWIKLRETMNYPQEQPLEVVASECNSLINDNAAIEDVTEYALCNNTQIIESRLAVREYKLHYAKAKGSWAPTISLSAGISTNYFTNMDGKSVYPTFASQFANNSGTYVGMSLSLPIFSNLSRRSSVRSARNALRNAELEHTATVTAVTSEIAQAYNQMRGQKKLYVQAQKKVSAAELAYSGAEIKFEKGLLTAMELQTVSTTLLQARSEMLQAQLQYLVESRMVDYYNGTPLIGIK